MLSFTVRMHFAEDDRPEITAIVRALTAASRQEPGCVTYVPHWVEGESATLLIYEQYADEAALEFHRSTTHFATYATAGLYQKMLDRTLEHLHAIA
jgi:quinol monooxygenase YgiN